MRGIGSRKVIGGSYAFRRSVFFAAARRRHLRAAEVGAAPSAEDDKENTPPCGSRSVRASRRWARGKRKSPLPVWYPRTPLRDITHLVNVIGRHRARLHATETPRNINSFIQAVGSPVGSPGQQPSEPDPEPYNPLFVPNLSSQPAMDSNPEHCGSPPFDNQAAGTSDPHVESDEKFKVLEELKHAVKGNLERVYKGNSTRNITNTLMTLR